MSGHESHRGNSDGGCLLRGFGIVRYEHCYTWTLAALALDLQGKAARVEALLGEPPVPIYDADNPNCPGSFEGHASGRRRDHRTVGTHRAWSDAGEWCEPSQPCSWCDPQIDPADLRDALRGALADEPEQVQQ